MDSTLSYQAQIKSIARSAFFHLWNIADLQPSFPDSVAETPILVFIVSRLSYCDGVLSGVPSKTLDRLQHVLNSTARVFIHTKPWHHITPTVVSTGFWSDIASYINSSSVPTNASTHLLYSLQPVWPPPPIHSSSDPAVRWLHTRLKSCGDRALSVAILWNSFPTNIHNVPTLDAFKSSLKTHLFTMAFPHHFTLSLSVSVSSTINS